MKKTIKRVRIVFHFATMTVIELLPFAKSIKQTIAADPDVTIDATTQSALGTQITALDGTVTKRETDKSKTLTQLEADQATAVVNTLTKIAHTTEDTANDIAAGDTAIAGEIITRIGFLVKGAAARAGRTFQVVRTASKSATIRRKALKKGTIYHWRWSINQQAWKRVRDTVESSVTIANLPGGGTIYFASAVSEPLGRNPVVDANVSEPNWNDPIHTVIPT